MNWIWIAVISVLIGVYYLYKQGKISWLDRIRRLRMFKVFESKPVDMVEKLKAQTEKEVAKAEELRKVLEAKREFVEKRADNIRQQMEIDGLSVSSVEKEKHDKQKAQEAEIEAKKVKPRRL